MGFSISVYSLATEDNYKELDGDIEFFEDRSNLVEFTDEEYQKLKDHLQKRDYKFIQKRNLLGSGIPAEEFSHKKNSITVLLTKASLYFEASGGEATLDASMDASELRKKMSMNKETKKVEYLRQFAVYDPYNGWID
jgi:hypothetical protein